MYWVLPKNTVCVGTYNSKIRLTDNGDYSIATSTYSYSMGVWAQGGAEPQNENVVCNLA